MRIELLYFDGCPSWQPALANLKAALDVEGLQATIETVEIRDDVQARAERFLGSPSFRVEGQDLWPEDRTEYALDCRVYHTPAGLRGWPTVDMLRERLRCVRPI